MEERVGSATTADKQYVYHPYYVDAIALMIDSSDDEHYYLQDANFNVTAVVDDQGTVEERYAYTPYGEVTILDSSFVALSTQESAIGNEFLYTGRRQDPETGLQLNRNRFYASHLGRWINRDPIGYRGQWLGNGRWGLEPNLYSYSSGRPLYGVDPYGLWLAVPSWGDYWAYFNPFDEHEIDIVPGGDIIQGGAIVAAVGATAGIGISVATGTTITIGAGGTAGTALAAERARRATNYANRAARCVTQSKSGLFK